MGEDTRRQLDSGVPFESEIAACVQDREPHLLELISSIPAAVYACDTQGRIIYSNRRASELADCEPLSKNVWGFQDPHEVDDANGGRLLSADAPMRTALAGGVEIANRELVLQRPDGSCIDVLLNAAPLRDPQRQVTGAVAVIRDVSELKRAQREREALMRELERSNEELSRFSYAISHDLQAPLRSVRALVQLLVRRNDRPPEDVANLAALIDQAAEGMDRLICSLLRYAQAGQGELNRERISAEAVVDKVRVSLGELIAKTGARISTATLPAVDADPAQLEQLFQNLISNAIKYHRDRETPTIEIRAEVVPHGWLFAVKDNGEGVSPEHCDVIFEPLKRLHGDDRAGSGLGLALCKTIVARHSGRIWVESDGPGRGATFLFTLASCPAPDAAHRPTT